MEGQTNGLITDLLSKIDPEMIAILVNAVYFRGSWALQFPPEATTDHPFELANGKKENSRMMSLSKNVMFRELPSGAKSVKLSYGKIARLFSAWKRITHMEWCFPVSLLRQEPGVLCRADPPTEGRGAESV